MLCRLACFSSLLFATIAAADEQVLFESNDFEGMQQQPTMHPAVTLLDEPMTTANSIKIRSLSSRTTSLFWDDGADGVPSGTLRPDQETTLNSYAGHVFYLTYSDDPSKKRLTTFNVEAEKALYVFYDDEFPGSEAVRKKTADEMEFLREYKERTGLLWRSFYGPKGPRPPPVLFQHPADFIGQKHRVVSSNGFWNCNSTAPEDGCQSQEPVTFDLEVIAREPRAFIISNFFTDAEADHIVATAKPRVTSSTVGNADGGGVSKSKTRTSKNTWVGRDKSAITETLYRRAADALGIDESLLHTSKNAEEMQVVAYDIGQKYDAHHDWGVSGYPESRFSTLLLYLTDKVDEDAGGETSFPKAKPAPIKVHPGKRSAVLFYNLLPDGNADDLALHAALPVKRGHKWLANFWVWDPKRK